MRWLVEVTSLGRAEKDSLYVDADSWQKALQSARTTRGEDGSLSGFSIELLDDGCRAVDPANRSQYLVHPAATVAARASQPQVGGPTSGVPRPASLGPPPGRTPSMAPATLMLGQMTPPMAPRPVDHAPRSVPPPAPAAGLQSVAVAPPPPLVPRMEHSSLVPSQVIYKREQDATGSLPLTYREYVYAVPPGSSESAAATLIQTQLELVRSSLDRMPPGKLVNLAVFDTTFQGKPPVPPLATLTWKDWRGEAIVSFPRQGGSAPVPVAPPPVVVAPQPAPQPPAPQAVIQQPVMQISAAPVHVFPPETAVYVAAQAPEPEPPPVQVPAPAARPVPQPQFPGLAPVIVAAAPFPSAAPIAPVPSIEVQGAAVIAPPPAFAPTAAAEPLPAGPDVRQPAAASPWRNRAPTPPGTQSGQTIVRAAGEDLIAYLFESMHELNFARDAVDGGNFCLQIAMEKLPSLAGIVLLYDINRREFLVSSTRGQDTNKLLLRRFPETDPLLALAMRRRRAIVVADAVETEAATNERYVSVGGARSLIVAPVMQAGRFLGAIELLNPLDGQPFTEAEGNAMTYIGEQFAEFVAARGVVTDPERISYGQDPRG